MKSVKIRAVLVGKSLIKNPWGEKVVKLEFVEERELPNPVVIQPAGSELAKEIMPIINQIMKSMPVLSHGKASIPRLTLYLTEEEWDRLIEKPEIGEEILIEIKGKSISISKN
ncbi:MAG: hypothetical protein DRJ38_01725 [Thermoprotei archaeon]|nr:MAG: hypothetical protein DRJ38_01725 [Thermoprotei archaeon]